MINKVSADLKTKLPAELVNAILESYNEIQYHFLLGRYEPSELNGGKFCEACFRILQFETDNGKYTALGIETKDLPGKLRNLENVVSADESYRFHIPRTLIAIYNIRNKRGVGHLAGEVSANSMDSTLVASCADWVLAELFRLHYQCPPDVAQSIVNSLVQRPLTLVYGIGEIKRVLLPSLTHRNQTLLLLATLYPQSATIDQLITWIEPAKKSVYSKLLRTLHTERLIELSTSTQCVITPTGLKYVEVQYQKWLKKLNKEE
jgi:hypothetical protein